MRYLGYEEIVREGDAQVCQICRRECCLLLIDGARIKAGLTRDKDIFEI